MTCHNFRIECKRHGKDRRGHQRYRCHQCRKTFLEPRETPLDGMYLPTEKAEMVLRLLLEGNSVSSTERITGVHHTTILKFVVLAGEKAEPIMAQKIRSVQVRKVELFRFSWKWRKRSPVKITERTHEEATEALHAGRESRHPEAASD